MNKHTPGPWHVVANLVQGKRKPNGDSRTVAIVGSSSEDDANARLIAAAPDLLAALELAVNVTEDSAADRAITSGLGVSEWPSFMPSWEAQARAAVAKARGE